MSYKESVPTPPASEQPLAPVEQQPAETAVPVEGPPAAEPPPIADTEPPTEAAIRIDPASGSPVPASPASDPFRVILRGMSQPKVQGRTITAETPLAALEAALAFRDYAEPEPVLEWQGKQLLASLDVDFHDLPLEQRPSTEQLAIWAASIRPVPALWWTTHGRGLRAIYAAASGMTAEELAACAAVAVRSLVPSAGIEIVARTRHPAYARPDYPPAGPINRCCPTVDLGPLARWLGTEADTDGINDWLAERGYEINRSYSHDRCPIDALSTSHGEPVHVGDAGIYCFKCEANGLTFGAKRPGFFPYSALVGGGTPRRLRSAARHFTHWEHAQHIVAEDLHLTGKLAQLCYVALLKAVHGPNDPRVDKVLSAGIGLVRMDGYWATSDLGRAHKENGLSTRLACLPALQELGLDKASKVITTVHKERHAKFQGVDDLSRYGYPAAIPVHGLRIATHWRRNTDPTRVHAVVLPEFLRPDDMARYRPTYTPRGKRMLIGEAEAVIDASFPGINHRYLRLLIAGRGCAEAGVGMPPRVATDGPSGAGKDTTVKVAAALVGDEYRDVPWVGGAEHFLQGLADASHHVGLVTSSEIIKKVARAPGGLLTNLTPLLQFDRGTGYHKHYFGPATVQKVVLLVITDIRFPPEMHADEQLGRRFVYVHLERQVNWHKSARLELARWRAAQPEHAQAGNALVSEVIDEFFSGEQPLVFEEIARELGFGLLKEGGDMGQDPREDLLALFDACCSPHAVSAPSSTYKGRGWKLVKRDGEDLVTRAWMLLCDDSGDGFVTSRRVHEADWAKLLGVTQPVTCDVSPKSNTSFGIRFRMGDPRSPELRVNEQIRALQTNAVLLEAGTIPAGGAASVDVSTPPANATDQTVPVAIDEQDRDPVFIDLETRSQCDLKRHGGRVYARHPSTELLSVVAVFDRRVVVWLPLLSSPLPVEGLWPDQHGPALAVDSFAGAELPPPLADAIAQGRRFCAHNAREFDALVWRALKLPEPVQWLDTLFDTRAAGLPGKLETVCQRLFGVGKDPEGNALLKHLCKPSSDGEFPPLGRADAARLVRYNLIDVLLLVRLYPVVRGCAEPEVVALDQVINERGIALDRDLAGAVLRLEAQMGRELGLRVEEMTHGEVKVTDLRRTEFLREWLRKRGVELPDLRAGTLTQLLGSGHPLDEPVRTVIQGRLTLNRTTASKLLTAQQTCDPDGRLRDLLAYHGAHTGRWAGRRAQPQNLPRPHRNIKNVEALIAATSDLHAFQKALPVGVSAADGIAALLRPCFRAGPGKVLLIIDYAAVEARGLAWCAGEQTQLQLFAEGGDNYCAFASLIFGRPVDKSMERERSIGKQAVLGCGYGMGIKRFAAKCETDGVDLAAAGTSAEVVVNSYRDAYPAIAGRLDTTGRFPRWVDGLWQTVERAAKDAIERGISTEVGRCRFGMENTTLVIQLPSGRRLRYRNARLEERVKKFGDSGSRSCKTIVFDGPKVSNQETYGAELVENIVQGVCRDLMVAGLQGCERSGLPVVLHVHDEVVVEVEAERALEALQQMAVILSTPPVWAAGFPVEVEGFAAERYVKKPSAGALKAHARNGQVLS